MLDLLYDFFYNTIFYSDGLVDFAIYNTPITFNGVECEFAEYLAFICSLISIIIILVLCCLFIGKIIKTIGRLFSGGTL